MARNGFEVMDSDMHVLEPIDLWERYIDPEFKGRAPKGVMRTPLDVAVEVDGKLSGLTGRGWGSLSHVYDDVQSRYAGDIERGFDAVAQLEAMNKEGIDVAVLFPSRGLFANSYEDMEPEFSRAIAQAYNNWMVDFCNAGDPARMYGAAMVPIQDIEEAVKEARRAVKDLGLKAVFLRAASPRQGVYYHQRAFDPLWAEMQELGVPVVFHEGVPSYMPNTLAGRFRQDEMSLSKTAFVLEQFVAVEAMTLGGVLERFPKLKVAFLEGNGSWLPFWLWRLDEIYDYTGKYEYPELSLRPSEYFFRQCFASCDCEETPAKQAIEVIGDEHFVFSTDYPHADSKYPNATELFLDLPFGEESKRKILWDNCARLYGF